MQRGVQALRVPSDGRILVTGSAGQIGSELVIELSKRYGEERVVGGDVKSTGNHALSFQYLDVADKTNIDKIVMDRSIGTIFHLAGILSVTGEKNLGRTWSVNINGLRNVLSVARGHKIRVFWPSSIAVFGSEAPRENTPQYAPLVPKTMYGVTKATGELLCNYYFTRYGVDVRSIRYPGIISSETPPGGGTTDYAVHMYYEAIRKRRYTCFVRRDTVLPMLYMPDCIAATLRLMEADSSQVNTRTSYNLGGLSFSAEELANEIKKYIPESSVDYEPDFRQEIADTWPKSVDDSAARKDWGWKPTYDLASMTQDMIKKLSKRLL
jgi:nucleoside-diphosphate-sugar epimerase